MLSSDKRGAGAAGGQLGSERLPRDDVRGVGEGATALQKSLGPVPVRHPSSWLPPPPSPAPSAIELEMRNLELLHHFTTVTYATFSLDDDIREIWRMVVPRIAFQHEFVMHGLLAMSALHLSFLNPTDKSYAMVATAHYTKALGSLRAGFPLLQPQDGTTLFAACSLTAVYVYACPPVDNMLPKAPTWIPLWRGITATTRQYWEWVLEGELSKLLLRKKADQSRYAGQDIEFPSSLFDLSQPGVPGELDPKELEDGRVLEIYREATEMLKDSWDQFWSYDPRIAAAFKWPATMSDGFLGFLVEQRPRALVLLAHHCVMPELLEDQFWWIKGRGLDEIKRIEGVLEEKWKHWLDWPKARCKISMGTG